MPSEELELLLVDPYATLCAEWERAFLGLPNVAIVNGVFEDQDFDCMTSAANSFGLMDGGIDRAIVNFFGEYIQEEAQKRIIEEFRGEQPVGTSFIIDTKCEEHPFVAHTPTMRIPMNISNTDNTYCAMYGVLTAVWNYNRTGRAKINRLACPGLGTAIGEMPHDRAANQMAAAYRNFIPRSELNWEHALEVGRRIG